MSVNCWSLNSATSRALIGPPGNMRMMRRMARWIRWMLVDSAVRKPPDRPTATQLRCHWRRRARGEKANDIGLGQHLAFHTGQQAVEGGVTVEIAAAIDDAIAAPVLQRNAPLPAASCAMARV
jgi:hypothetical protein